MDFKCWYLGRVICIKHNIGKNGIHVSLARKNIQIKLKMFNGIAKLSAYREEVKKRHEQDKTKKTAIILFIYAIFSCFCLLCFCIALLYINMTYLNVYLIIVRSRDKCVVTSYFLWFIWRSFIEWNFYSLSDAMLRNWQEEILNFSNKRRLSKSHDFQFPTAKKI